jgi:hypothetical protein
MGNERRRATMAKAVTNLALAAIFVLCIGVVAGCSGSTSAEPPTTPTTEPPPTSTTTTTQPPTTTTTVATSTTRAVTTSTPSTTQAAGTMNITAEGTITTTAGSRTHIWGDRAEINNCYAAVERPVEVTSTLKPEGGKIVVAEVSVGSYPGGTFTAYDRQGNKYSPLSVPWEENASSGGQGSWPLTGFLVFGMPSDATVLGIVWDWPIFEWVNVLIWE